MDLSIVIVNWNSREHLRRCLASIQLHVPTIAHEIIVIDSGSFDGTDAMLREKYPDVRFIQSATNLGFARANNRAAAHACGEFLLFLNPDTEVVGSAIDTLYAAFKTLPDAGVVGGTLLNADGTVQSSCIQSLPTLLNQLLDSEVLRARWPRSRLWGVAALYDASDGPREVEAISGACLMVRRKTFEELGRFSEDYFMYAEDMDLSYTARRAGYRNYYVAAARVVHYGGGSSGDAASLFSAVMLPEALSRFFAKMHGNAYALAYRLTLLMSACVRLGVLKLARLVIHDREKSEASYQKWLSVLRWTLNRAELVRQYYPAVPAGTRSRRWWNRHGRAR